jgi:hypothetical protein
VSYPTQTGQDLAVSTRVCLVGFCPSRAIFATPTWENISKYCAYLFLIVSSNIYGHKFLHQEENSEISRTRPYV